MANTSSSEQLRAALDAPVTDVTVMEDRAHVTRRGSAELAQGVQRLVLRNVAPVIGDKTLMVKIAGDGARLIDARVGRERVVRNDDTSDTDEPHKARDTFELERELEALDETIATAAGEHALLVRHAAVVEKIAKSSIADLAADAAWGGDIGVDWTARLDHVRDDQRALHRNIVESTFAQETLYKERARLEMRLQSSDNQLDRADAWIAIELDVTTGGVHEVCVDYIVPGACWRPYHTARLASDSGSVEFRTDACVWQNTGEDWSGVSLRLSTERPSLGVEPPQLESDVVAARKKSDKIQVASRDQAIETTGLGGEVIDRPPEVPGIDDGGDVQLLHAPGDADVPSDGRPYRIELGTFSSSAELELVCMPELTDCVISKTMQTNESVTPILAGPVDLIRDSGYVGRTSVLFITQGERFELGWGPDPALRVTRETEVHREKSRMLSSWITRTHDVRIHVSNIGVHEKVLCITERIPVSEIEKLEISADAKHTRGGQRPDDNGFVAWTLTVPAHGTERVDLRYMVKKHEDVQGY